MQQGFVLVGEFLFKPDVHAPPVVARALHVETLQVFDDDLPEQVDVDESVEPSAGSITNCHVGVDHFAVSEELVDLLCDLGSRYHQLERLVGEHQLVAEIVLRDVELPK